MKKKLLSAFFAQQWYLLCSWDVAAEMIPQIPVQMQKPQKKLKNQQMQAAEAISADL